MPRPNKNDFEGCGRLAFLAGMIVSAASLTILFKCDKTNSLIGKIIDEKVELLDNKTVKSYRVLWENSSIGKRWYSWQGNLAVEMDKKYNKGDFLSVSESMPYEPFRFQNTDKK